MPPFAKFLRRIALTAAMVNKFISNTKHTQKRFLAS
jgi:hypothetical protein